MTKTQTIHLSHMSSILNDLPLSSPHHVQRKWSDTFVGVSAGENGRLTKTPRKCHYIAPMYH